MILFVAVVFNESCMYAKYLFIVLIFIFLFVLCIAILYSAVRSCFCLFCFFRFCFVVLFSLTGYCAVYKKRAIVIIRPVGGTV